MKYKGKVNAIEDEDVAIIVNSEELMEKRVIDEYEYV